MSKDQFSLLAALRRSLVPKLYLGTPLSAKLCFTLRLAHARTSRRVILSGKDNADALHYQEKQVSQALREVKR